MYQKQRVSVDKVYQVKIRVKGQNKVTKQSKVKSKSKYRGSKMVKINENTFTNIEFCLKVKVKQSKEQKSENMKNTTRMNIFAEFACFSHCFAETIVINPR